MKSILAAGLLLLVAACGTTSQEVRLLQAHNSACAALEAGVNAAATRYEEMSDERWAKVSMAAIVMEMECGPEADVTDLRASLERIRNAEGDLP